MHIGIIRHPATHINSLGFAVSHVFDARSGEDADGSIVAHVCFVRGYSLCQRNRILQSAEPKEAVVERKYERRFAMSGTI